MTGAILSLLALGVLGCGNPVAPKMPPPVVEVAEVVAANVPTRVEVIGQLDSPKNIEVRARVEGFVDRILFEDGTEVKEGAPLYALDPKPYQARLLAAEGALAEAKASLNKYERDVARLRPLAEKRAIPQQDLDNSLASVEVGKAGVAAAEARVGSARIELGYCDIRAPGSGLIGASQAPVGSLVGKGQPTLLATISQLDPIWFYCAISEVEYLRAERKALETGHRVAELPATLILSDGTEFPETGRWVFMDRAVDAATGTLRARAQFANPQKLLRPGMFARARVSLKSEKDSLAIPQRAVQELQGRNFVWVVNTENQASQRAVRVGARVGSDWVIEEGLKVGERIVVEGLQKVREGAPVTPMTAAQLAQAAAAAMAPAPQKSAKE